MPPRRARPAAAPAADPAQQLADRLHSAAIHLLRRLRREDASSGLTAPRLSALSVLVFGGPMTLGQLAAAEQVRPPSMTRLVSALEAQGLVVREPGARDRREVRIRPTAAGRALLLRGRERRVSALAGVLRALPAAEREALEGGAGILERVIRELAAEPRATPSPEA